MRVLILGGSGLISTETTRCLLEGGHETFALTRGKTPFRVSETAGRKVTPVIGNRDDKDALKRILADVNPEVIIDFFCFQPQQMRDLLASRNRAAKHLIFISTVCALGGPLAEHPAGANTECRPVFDYGQNKKELEQIVLEASAKGVIAGTNFRPSSTDGPGAWLSGNLSCRDGAFFRLLKEKRPVIVCAGGVLCHHGSTRDVGRAVALSVGREVCFGRTYNCVGDECVTQAEWTRRSARGIGISDPNIVEMPADFLCERLKDWKGVGFLKYIWRYHGAFDTSALKRDVPEWRPEVNLAETARLTWEWGEQSGQWKDVLAKPLDIEPEPLCAAYDRARGEFLK
jgi:nucleoside-diphosphate-sugar epimerase